jgi:predicted Zn-dependent protease with MMP-like domain
VQPVAPFVRSVGVGPSSRARGARLQEAARQDDGRRDRTVSVGRERFEALVAAALDSLPEEIAAAMENVEVVVEEEPPPEALAGLPPGETLLGLYHGVPLSERGPHTYHGVLPDKISIYRGPIARRFRTPARIEEEVRRTVVHEIAHHFGIDDERLHELGW